MAILIGVQKITKAFGATPLFRDLSFTLETGNRVGLIGPNGTGKSTLLKILAGLDSPDSGKISIQRGMTVGYLEQSPQFRAGVTVQEAVLESVAGDWENSAQAMEMLSRLRLNDAAKPVRELSGGWQKRVALARELAKKPDLLLLDEPTNHLDV
ncbi:MAG: ATP-binding cassette domain-containing protein, partial [Bdellovibrionota bacterium]